MSNTKFCQGPASSIYPAREKVSIDMKHFTLIEQITIKNGAF